MKTLIKTAVVLYLIIIIGAILFRIGAIDYIKYKLTDNDKNIPKELYICFNELDKWDGERERAQFKSAKENELGNYHFGMGLYIRNYWIRNDGLNINLEEKLREAGLKSADEMSSIIVNSYHRYLNKKDIRFFEQITEIEDRYTFEVSKYEVARSVLFVTIMQLLMSFMLLGWSKFAGKLIYRLIFIESNLVWFILIYECLVDFTDNINEILGSIIAVLIIVNICLLILSILFLGVYLIKKYIHRSSNVS